MVVDHLILCPERLNPMYFIYNLLQLLFIAVFFPFIVVYVCSKEKYRDRIPSRLGFGLRKEIVSSKEKPLTIWLHALSVGEVTSAVPLLQGIRAKYPKSRIVVSATTKSGKEVADKLLPQLADHIINSPLDILPIVIKFNRIIRPDLYILVETDFWPNILQFLHHKKIPMILVNGRVSDHSMDGYRRMQFFFRPMFNTFRLLFMQTEHDKNNMATLLGKSDNIHTFGNLKFDTPLLAISPDEVTVEEFLLPEGKTFLIAGSTHPGEEQIFIQSYAKLRKKYPELHLILAPRDHKRAKEIVSLAAQHGMTCTQRSRYVFEETDIYLLDTIGELVQCYAISAIGFVGGSLVKKGGHNPIEPAAMGIPVLFGPDMSDFREISESLLESGGAYRITDEKSLQPILSTLLDQPELRKKQGTAAQNCVKSQCGVVSKHIDFIQQVL